MLFILHAEHEQTCSTSAVRCIASTHADPYSAVAAGIAALHGPRHGGANEDAVRMLQEIGSVDRVRELLAQVKAGERELELKEFPDPAPGPGEVVIEMKASGMCGSDLHAYRASREGGGMGAALGFAAPVACCADEATATCGLSMMAGGECSPPAVEDNRCPDTDLSGLMGLGAIAGGAIMGGYGCCIDNQCGVDAAAFGGGCTENSAARAQVEALPLVGALIAPGIPDPRGCDEGGDAGGEDAGH